MTTYRGSLDHLIRALQERRRDREAKGIGGLEVDDQLELRSLLDGEVARLRALKILSTHPGCPATRGAQGT
jgi:hypothetical protein